MLKYQIQVKSYDEAFRYVYNHAGYQKGKKFAIISIQEYETDKMGFKYVPGGNLIEALNIYFSDIKDSSSINEDDETKRLMTDEDALQIKKFIEVLNKRNDIELLIIHCHAGISRSAAVAAAISKIFNGTDNEYFYSDRYNPNMYVYTKIMKAFGFENNRSSFK